MVRKENNLRLFLAQYFPGFDTIEPYIPRKCFMQIIFEVVFPHKNTQIKEKLLYFLHYRSVPAVKLASLTNTDFTGVFSLTVTTAYASPFGVIILLDATLPSFAHLLPTQISVLVECVVEGLAPSP